MLGALFCTLAWSWWGYAAPALSITTMTRPRRTKYTVLSTVGRLAHDRLLPSYSQQSLWVGTCNGQQCASCTAGLLTALLPTLQGANRRPNECRKLRLRQAGFLSWKFLWIYRQNFRGACPAGRFFWGGAWLRGCRDGSALSAQGRPQRSLSCGPRRSWPRGCRSSRQSWRR